MNELDLIHRFWSILPSVVAWIDTILEEHRDRTVTVDSLGFSKLSKVLPLDLLGRAKVVIVSGKPPFPSLTEMGLPEFKQMETMQMAGITYKDTVFLNQQHQTESLYFHELVHVAQWERLGVNDFLLAYGAGLMQFGYRESPLEKMAYTLQDAFDRGNLPMNTIELIRQGTDIIWSGLASLFYRT